MVYEGYGPNGVAVIVEALTDNRNRTASDVRAAFSKHDGNLGGSGAVAWLFERRGLILVDADRADEDELTLAAAEGGAEDVEQDGSSFRVTSAPEVLTAVREAIEQSGIEVESAELTMIPKTTVSLDDESDGQEDAAADRRAGGERRRPGGLLQLRHPRAGDGGGGVTGEPPGSSPQPRVSRNPVQAMCRRAIEARADRARGTLAQATRLGQALLTVPLLVLLMPLCLVGLRVGELLLR